MKLFLFGLLLAGWLDAADSFSSSFQAPAPSDILKPNVLFRLHGSNTIGSELAPALAEAYLRQRGAGNVHYQPSNVPGQGIEIGTMPDDIGQVAIEINATGSLLAPSHLAKGLADVAMMSTKMTPEDCTKLAPLGDMQSAQAENALGADGIAIIVNRANVVNKLNVDQLRQIFSGQLTNWKDVGGIDSPIKLYGLATSSSGTYQTFESIVLKPEKLSAGAKQVASNAELSNLVAHDPAGIGFVGMPFVRAARAVAIEFNAADGTTQTLLPTLLTVGPERYLLSRRLYLYLSPKSKNAEARQFVAFALSTSGQTIVEKKGFVSFKLRSERTKRQNNEPSPLGVAFRFRDGSTLLDDKALLDLDRLVEYVQSLDHPPTLLLIGHSDNLGSEDANLKLSKERAKAVADELRARGVDIAGTGGQGSKSPVASNDTPEGRQLNRRVEIWSRM